MPPLWSHAHGHVRCAAHRDAPRPAQGRLLLLLRVLPYLDRSQDAGANNALTWDTGAMSKKPKRPKREDVAQSAFRALQHIINSTEGVIKTAKSKPAPKRKAH